MPPQRSHHLKCKCKCFHAPGSERRSRLMPPAFQERIASICQSSILADSRWPYELITSFMLPCLFWDQCVHTSWSSMAVKFQNAQFYHVEIFSLSSLTSINPSCYQRRFGDYRSSVEWEKSASVNRYCVRWGLVALLHVLLPRSSTISKRLVTTSRESWASSNHTLRPTSTRIHGQSLSINRKLSRVKH